MRLVVLGLNIGGEVVSDVDDLANVVLNHQGHIGGHGEGHLSQLAGGLVRDQRDSQKSLGLDSF